MAGIGMNKGRGVGRAKAGIGVPKKAGPNRAVYGKGSTPAIPGKGGAFKQLPGGPTSFKPMKKK